jgi:hypothetical protein
MCEFWLIGQEVAMVYSAPGSSPITERVPLTFAESRYQMLLDWADTLGSEMTRGSDSTAHAIMFQ